MKFKLSLLSAALVSVVSAPALAQLDFESWDEDSNGNVSLAEWDAAIESENVFDKLDANNNSIFDVDEAVEEDVFPYDISMDLDDGGHIERQEFTVGTFNRLDGNDDDMLSQQEFADFRDKASRSEIFAVSQR